MAYQKKSVSQKDIAKKAGVSISLVSFVLNDKYKEHRVNEDVAQRIKKIAKAMNYSPNILARSLRDGKTRTIGVILSDISNPFFSHIARQVEYNAEKLGYSVYFSSSDEDSSRAASIVESMLRKGVDGIIFAPCQGSEATVSSLLSREVPLVLVDRYFPDIKSCYVCLENQKSAYDATELLLHNGFRNVGFIMYDSNLKHMSDREEGYRMAMRDNGLEGNVHVRYVSHFNMEKSCAKAVKEMCDCGADALLMASNSISIECLRHLVKMGVNIPDKMGIIGFDGDNAFEFFSTPITYVKQPVEQIAQKATEILIEQIEKGRLIQQVEFEGTIVKKQSSSRTQNPSAD